MEGTPRSREIRELYPKRFGIETSYRQMNEARIKTCARSAAAVRGHCPRAAKRLGMDSFSISQGKAQRRAAVVPRTASLQRNAVLDRPGRRTCPRSRQKHRSRSSHLRTTYGQLLAIGQIWDYATNRDRRTVFPRNPPPADARRAATPRRNRAKPMPAEPRPQIAGRRSAAAIAAAGLFTTLAAWHVMELPAFFASEVSCTC